jgi:hypothetical protein
MLSTTRLPICHDQRVGCQLPRCDRAIHEDICADAQVERGRAVELADAGEDEPALLPVDIARNAVLYSYAIVGGRQRRDLRSMAALRRGQRLD